MTLQERIQAGIALLDEHTPDWREHLWVDGLDMGSNTDGLLEQLYGSFVKGMNALGLRTAQGYQYGFDIAPAEGTEEANKKQWHKLTEAWKQAINFVPFHESEMSSGTLSP